MAAVPSKRDAARAGQSSGAQSKGKTSKRKISTERAPKPAGPFSQAIGAGNTIYVAGQVPRDPRTGLIVSNSFDEQAVQVFENIKAILEAAGASLADVVKVNVYLTDLSHFAKLNEIYARYFQEDYPVRTTVGVQLAVPMLIEADCIAVKNNA